MLININVNNEVKQVATNSSLESLQQQLNIPTLGYVFAINDQIIPRGLWSQTLLNEGDQISLFQAIAGG